MVISVSQSSPLERLSDILLALPEVEREDAGRHAGFKVRERTVAWFTEDHHGDGMIGVTCKAHPGENEALIARSPERYFMPSYLGAKGWVGLRLDTPSVDWREVGHLVSESYRLVAPKRLAALVSED